MYVLCHWSLEILVGNIRNILAMTQKSVGKYTLQKAYRSQSTFVLICPSRLLRASSLIWYTPFPERTVDL
jgi:hypothetical protein